jgi:hypothetical protein
MSAACVAGPEPPLPAAPLAEPAAAHPAIVRVEAEPRMAEAGGSDFAYLVAMLEIVAESPLPLPRAGGVHWHYRILGATQQGNCVNGCPLSTVFVAVSTFDRNPTIRLYRIDGLQHWRFGKVTRYGPAKPGVPFLAFTAVSMESPRECFDYLVEVGTESGSIKRVSRNTRVFGCAP